ncbi:hypothetical protein HK101_002529, partial [Irineochytrium annulatum]
MAALLLLMVMALGAEAITTVNVMLFPILSNTSIELNSMRAVTDAYFPANQTGIQVNYQMASTLVSTEYATMVEAYLSTADPSIDLFM